MITNVIATLIVMVTTNVYAPKQYKASQWITTYPAQVEDSWQDCPSWAPNGIVQGQAIRDNPDVQFVEVREIRKWRFNLEGVPDHVISDTLVSRTKRVRKVETKETWETVEVQTGVGTNAGSVTNIFRVYGTDAACNGALEVNSR